LNIYTNIRSGTRNSTTIISVLFFVALTALTARIAIPLPYTPVPITLQVFAVLLSGLALGARGGALSQIGYLSVIALGLPFSSTGVGGLPAFMGPTGGYLLAFIPSAFVVGLIAQCSHCGYARRLAACLSGILVIHLGGASWLAVWLGGDIAGAWQLGIAPFIMVDLLKAIVAVVLTRGGTSRLAI
jgi:biotin transport system substrate-specific component